MIVPHPSAEPTFPIRWLTGAVALTVGVLLALGWSTYDSYRNFVTVQLHDLRLAELRGNIVHLDEVLTMSARMAATTGDPRWEQRYRTHEPALDAATKETVALTTQSASAEAARETDAANLKLVALENQAFDFVRAGRTSDARTTLFGEEYETQKKIYAAGMATVIEDIKARLAASQRALWQRTVFFGISAVTAAVVLVLVWVTVLGRVQRWRDALAHAVQTQQRQQTELRVLFDLMPAMVMFKDTENGILRVNQRVAEKTGKSVAEIEGKSSREIFPHDAESLFGDDLEVIRSGQPKLGVIAVAQAADGEPVWIQTDKVPVFDSTGKAVGIVVMAQDITERKLAEAALEQTHQKLVDASRQAGMAEVSTGVLHNVGNVLNSVNVSATLVADQMHHSKVGGIEKLASLLDEHKADLTDFLTRDPRGEMIPRYLGTLATALAGERTAMLKELAHLRKNIDHIKDIISMQQSFAKNAGFLEPVSLTELAEDAWRMNASSLARHDVEIVRDYQIQPTINTDKHKVVQILLNLLRNAKHACDASGRADKRVTVRITGDAQRVQISVRDNGVGIPAENLPRIFNHGFTTKKDGHGFGLHSSALAAKELGGALTVQSDGPGLGATFSLELPVKAPAVSREESAA